MIIMLNCLIVSVEAHFVIRVERSSRHLSKYTICYYTKTHIAQYHPSLCNAFPFLNDGDVIHGSCDWFLGENISDVILERFYTIMPF